jgi:GAF domain-containing protein
VTETEDQFRRLLEVGKTLVSELDPETVLERILEEARRLTGARYAALGVLDEQRMELERFVTAGVDDVTHRRIGELPRGRGVLGVLITDPRPLRLARVDRDPNSYGFPAGHPAMTSFLGVPIVIRGQAWGNLYLTEKADGAEFSDGDEAAVIAVARWAAIAIENARIHKASEQHREQLERTVSSLEAARNIADALGSVSDLNRALELIVKRGRALVEARSLLIMLREGEELVVVASAGHATGLDGQKLPIRGSTYGRVLERGRPERVADIASAMRMDASHLDVPDARTALLVPMMPLDASAGVLAAFDRDEEAREFSVEDERLLCAFAQSAANVAAIKRSAEADRLRSALACAERERRRWAHALRDKPLQVLDAVRVQLATAAERADAAPTNAVMLQAIDNLELAIESLRLIVAELESPLPSPTAATPTTPVTVPTDATAARLRNEQALP